MPVSKASAETRLTIGTRGSELALAQAREVRERLREAHGDAVDPVIEVISTKGDRITDRPLAEIGGKGLFTEEIEERLVDGRLDIAVHSAKDMPTILPGELALIAFLPREAPGDAFISRNFASLAELPKDAVVGSASLRRGALINRLRPDIRVINFRGNVQSRLAKLEAGKVDATLLAVAGLNRLGLAARITEALDLADFPPAPGQGAICIEARRDNARIAGLLSAIDDPPTHTALLAERAYLKALDGSCRTPIAGHACLEGGTLHFHGMILSPDGVKCHETHLSGNPSEAETIGKTAAETLREAAGSGFFADWNTGH